MGTEIDLNYGPKRSAILPIDARISFIERKIFEIKGNILELKSIVLIMLISSVAALGSLHFQINSLSRDMARLDARLNNFIYDLSDKNELMPRDFRALKSNISRINSKLDSLIKVSNSEINSDNENFK